MHHIVFYPVGNGDTCQIILNKGQQRLLFDFHHQSCSDFNLTNQLKKELSDAQRDYFDIVAFTHADSDHIGGSTEFFELEHAAIYQGNDRVKIKELWVPAAMIMETCSQDQMSDEFIIWRREARYRLKNGHGIRVFSKPSCLRDWFISENIPIESRSHLITDAGNIVPGFNLVNNGVEFFCHSPFIKHTISGDDLLRNEASLIFQIRFDVNETITEYLAIGDSVCSVLDEIVSVSEYHGNEDRLKWDLINVPHHCSAFSLNTEKGVYETQPTEGVRKLLLHGRKEAYMISSSNPIPDNNDAYTQIQPPHIQAKKCYESHLKQVGGRKMFVTMEYPTIAAPKPIKFEISSYGCRIDNSNIQASTGISSVITSPANRAG
ncbi:hypothetical protein [Legionella feeleii]|uniref:Metallo-beta-lactamase domain-containing protein n=1 Tax=Legionella feeleii TaxID=453 RepID=A0A378IWR3_9GAMM|nr:hypothetical protein [Legionella feeleii]STX39579.1 Uncharacterised protein [Legionella feeleii]